MCPADTVEADADRAARGITNRTEVRPSSGTESVAASQGDARRLNRRSGRRLKEKRNLVPSMLRIKLLRSCAISSHLIR